MKMMKATTSAPGIQAPTKSTFSQWKSLLRGEMKLLLRNSVQMAYALIFPLLMPVLFLNYAPALDELPQDMRVRMLGLILSGALIVGCTMSSYYTAVSALVNRREEAVLQRMRAGEARDATILAALLTPGTVMALVTGVAVFVLLYYLVDIPITVNLWLVVLGLVLTILACIGFALLTANYTRTAESAQVSAVPFMLVAMLGVGSVMVPREVSEVMYWVLNLTPTAPMAQLISQGLVSEVDWTLVARSLGLAVAWIGASIGYGWARLRWARRA